ncbi:hypothetical protein M427DRAFT_71499 [Gonapodya prolifera JEL478]|uniref:TmcB/TmcC TPR repeats domain-containing protein n=1 Tax=Gonapodya prolifera (strain JEL478) TaxID=1344416 RepID=A0A139A9B2_GONPJ|nr:hypothetical protein M427DRAFT_71499 [Gonapodya prolifera JEL478]|eukprot:KXS13274.1 hypothetical protein M427DRAFT_71499 [Gonapodya prolifera JEL478]
MGDEGTSIAPSPSSLRQSPVLLDPQISQALIITDIDLDTDHDEHEHEHNHGHDEPTPGPGLGLGQLALLNESNGTKFQSFGNASRSSHKKNDREVPTAKRSRIELTLFSVLHSMVAGNEVPPSLAYPLTIFEDMQLLYFCWHPGHSLPGMPSWIHYIWNPLTLRPGNFYAFLAIFSAAWLVVSTLVGTICFCGFSFSRGKFKYVWPLILLRSGTLLAVGILNIPITEIFLVPLDCDNGALSMYPQVACYTSVQHLVPFILSIIGLVLFIPYTIVMALVYVDGNPKSANNPLTRAHGRTDLLYVVVKLVVVFVWEFPVPPANKLVILVVFMLFLTKETIQKQPFHDVTLQSIRSGIFVAAVVSSFISLLSEVLGASSLDSLGPFITLVVSLPFSFALGFFLNRWVINTVTRRIYMRFQAQIKDMRTKTGMLSFAGVERNGPRLSRRVSIVENQISHVLDDIGTNIMSLTSEKTVKEPPVFRSPHEVEIACRFVRNTENPNALILMREIFEAAFLQYPKDGFVHITAALYLLAFSSETTMLLHPSETNAEKAETLLCKLASMRNAFDVRFLSFVCEKLIEQTLKVGGGVIKNVVCSYVEVLSQENYAKTYHIASLSELKAFWTSVRRGSTTKDYLDYPNYLPFIADATSKAKENYHRLTTRFPKSKNTLRLFAQFTGTVLADAEECRRLLASAEELEELEQGSDFDLTKEHPRHLLKQVSLEKNASLARMKGFSEENHDEGPPNSVDERKLSRRTFSDAEAPVVSRKAASSHGGSSQTSESREVRRQRIMRNEFIKRLVNIPLTFSRRLKILAGVCVIVATCAIGYTTSVFSSVAVDVNSFLTTTEIGRMAVASIQAARLMSYFGSKGDNTSYQYWKKQADSANTFTATVSLPYLIDRSSLQTGMVDVVTYDKITKDALSTQPYSKSMNQYQAIPKKALDDILLQIDEQLELLVQDGVEGKAGSSTIQDGARGGHRITESLNVIASLFLIGACACAILLPLIYRLPTNTTYVSLVNYTGGRKYMVRMVRTLGYEVLINDNTTWLAGRPEMHMRYYIDKMEALHLNSMTGHGEREIPPTSSIEIIRPILAEPGCNTDCDPNVKHYNGTIGWTFDEAVAPVDQMINDYIRAAREFLIINALQGSQNFVDDRMRFMEEIQVDIVAALLKVDELVLNVFLPQGNNNAMSASIALFVLTVISITGLYTFNFRGLIERRVQQMEIVVCLLHMVPQAALNASPKLTRLIQTGGATLGEDE